MIKHYFIRHAHRGELKGWGHQVSITAEGRKASEKLGRVFANQEIKAIWTSPVKRCVQSATQIKKGIGTNLSIHSSTLLGDPGFMISNPKLAEESFQTYPLVQLIDLLLAQKPVPGFYPLDVGCKQILACLLKNRGQSQVWITHDINICILACWIFHWKRVEAMLPNFLEGIEFSFSEAGCVAYFKGLRIKIDETRLRGMVDSSKKPAFLNSELNSSSVLS